MNYGVPLLKKRENENRTDVHRCITKWFNHRIMHSNGNTGNSRNHIHSQPTQKTKEVIMPAWLGQLAGQIGSQAARYRDWETDRKSTRLNSSHITRSRMPSSA